MKNGINLWRSPDADNAQGAESSKYAPENSQSLAQTLHNKHPVTSSPGEEPYTGSHADNAEAGQSADRNVPNDGPSGENTKNGGERGGGLWTSGGEITTGTPYHDEDES